MTGSNTCKTCNDKKQSHLLGFGLVDCPDCAKSDLVISTADINFCTKCAKRYPSYPDHECFPKAEQCKAAIVAVLKEFEMSLLVRVSYDEPPELCITNGEDYVDLKLNCGDEDGEYYDYDGKEEVIE